MTAPRTGKGEDKYKRAPNGVGTSPRLYDDGYWHAWVIVGKKKDGSPDRRHIKRRKAEAAIERYTELMKLAGQELVAAEMVAPGTAGEWFMHWLEEIVEPNLKNSTYTGYSGHLRRAILPAIGSIRLADLSEIHIRRMLEGIPTKPMQRAVLKTVRAALKVAWRNRMINEDVSLRVVLPRTRPADVDDDDFEDIDPKPVRNVNLPLEDARIIINAALDWRNGVRVAIALIYGLRSAELRGLCWTDFDFENKTFQVLRNVGRTEEAWRHGCYNPALCGTEARCPNRIKRGIVDTTKTESSKRNLPLTDEVIAVLKEHRRRQLEERLACDVPWPKREWVFTQKNGKPIDHRNSTRQWKAMLKKAGLPEHYTMHGLRHTAATEAGDNGADPKTMQAILGWADIKMANIYQHKSNSRVRAVIERQSKGMFGS